MDVEKVSFNVDTLCMRLEEQVPIESAIPLPQGRTAGSVLSVTPQLQIREVRVSETGVRLSGQLQLEKQEMIIVCKPEDSPRMFDELWKNTVDFFRSLEIPVRTLECCSGDLADLKVKSLDVEAWSPRQQKYFEVGSCSNLGDAQARRLGIRIKSKDKQKGNYFAHTLNNTVVAPPRMLIAFLENHLQADGSVTVPEPLRPYMGGKDHLE